MSRVLVTNNQITGVLDWMIEFIYALHTPPVIARNYIAMAISTLYNSLLHTHTLVVSW
jgi:hypothetical protein